MVNHGYTHVPNIVNDLAVPSGDCFLVSFVMNIEHCKAHRISCPNDLSIDHSFPLSFKIETLMMIRWKRKDRKMIPLDSVNMLVCLDGLGSMVQNNH